MLQDHHGSRYRNSPSAPCHRHYLHPILTVSNFCVEFLFQDGNFNLFPLSHSFIVSTISTALYLIHYWDQPRAVTNLLITSVWSTSSAWLPSFNLMTINPFASWAGLLIKRNQNFHSSFCFLANCVFLPRPHRFTCGHTPFNIIQPRHTHQLINCQIKRLNKLS